MENVDLNDDISMNVQFKRWEEVFFDKVTDIWKGLYVRVHDISIQIHGVDRIQDINRDFTLTGVVSADRNKLKSNIPSGIDTDPVVFEASRASQALQDIENCKVQYISIDASDRPIKLTFEGTMIQQ